MDYDKLKSHLQASFRVIGWEPTEDEMREIAKQIRETKPKTIEELAKIVESVRAFGLVHAMEGEDNTDLNLLLVMATRLAQTK